MVSKETLRIVLWMAWTINLVREWRRGTSVIQTAVWRCSSESIRLLTAN